MDNSSLFQEKQFFENLKLKYQHVMTGKPLDKEIRLGIFFCSGGMRGIWGAGVTEGLHRYGLGGVFDVVIGVSTGAANAAYFLGGREQAKIGASIYCEDLPGKFVTSLLPPKADVKLVRRLISEGKKKIDVEAVRNNPAEFYVLVTDQETGKSVMMDAKAQGANIPEIIEASISMPGLTDGTKVPVIDGRPYIDGAVGNSFPAQAIIERFGLTDILIIANRSQKVLTKFLRVRKWFTKTFIMRGVSEKIRDLAVKRNESLVEGLKYLKVCKDVKSYIVWGPKKVRLLTMKKFKLENARKGGFLAVRDLAKKAGIINGINV